MDERAMDIAVIPSGPIPARFLARSLYEEDFVVTMRMGHPFADDPSLERYCEMQHLVVSFTGDPSGFVDEHLAKQGRSRRISLTVPNFMFALAMVAETDLISALPRRFVAMHAARFPVVALDPPLELPRFRLDAIIPEVAMMDAGLAWLFSVLVGSQLVAPKQNKMVSHGVV
jgi:DNA-binding transcriptional LysR family regulator